jgi:hypothetical protein
MQGGFHELIEQSSGRLLAEGVRLFELAGSQCQDAMQRLHPL